MEGSENLSLLQLQQDLEHVQREQRQTLGRSLALEIGLATALRMWGKPAAEVREELRQALDRSVKTMHASGMHADGLGSFSNTGSTLMETITGAVNE